MRPSRPDFEASSGAARLAWWIGRRSPTGRVGLVALVLACAGTGTSLWQVWSARQALSEIAMPAAPAPRPSAFRGDVPTRQQVRAWNVVARQLNMPWARVLDTLEDVTPADVALVAIEPESRDGTLRLQAEAVALDPLLAYAQRLRGTGAFAEATLLKHETHEQDPQRPVRITLMLRLTSAEVAR